MDDILEDLRSQLQSMSRGRGEHEYDVSAVVDVLENECRRQYKDPGSGIHFVGVLLAVLVAEVVSRWWERRQSGGKSETERESLRMVTCLYSKHTVAFALSHSNDVSFLD